MVNTRSNPAASEQGEASAARGENLPHPPSLAEVMPETERNKRETNRLLERIEQNTPRHQRKELVSIIKEKEQQDPCFSMCSDYLIDLINTVFDDKDLVDYIEEDGDETAQEDSI